MQLSTFIQNLAQKPFAWGQTDCALVIADWWQARHGVDPAAHLRGTYGTEGECAATLKRYSGLPVLVARLARSVGAERTRDPKPGDFGVLRLDGRFWGAVMGPSGRWVIKPHDGIASIAPDLVRCVAAWSRR